MDNVSGSSTTAPAPESVTRRNFYVGVIYGLGATIAAALGLPAAIYLLFPPKSPPNRPVGRNRRHRSLAADVPTQMTFRRNRVDGWKVTGEKATAWVVKHADNSITAFGPQCTHLGCAYHWDEKQGRIHLSLP